MLNRSRDFPIAVLALLLMLGLLHGCATLPLDYPRKVSTAIALPEETHMGKRIQVRVTKHQGKSGFYLLSSGYDAFMARIMVIDRAEKTLDLQYYIFHADRTGKFLLDHLVAAAERGVRVRLLVDDWPQAGKMDWRLAMVQGNPNIEVRVFNPYGAFRSFLPARAIETMFGPARLQGRMHNKVFVADNCVAIVGGRNIADEYFGARAAFNYGDLDIIAIGPITQQISAVFDDYWNCVLSIPMSALVKKQPTEEDLEKVHQFLAANRRAMEKSEYAQKLKEAELPKRVEAGYVPFVWARGEILYDDPLKIMAKEDSGGEGRMSKRLGTILAEAKSELLMISPYFVPGKRGVEWFKKMRERGVKIKILTNSLASTDVPIAEGGYAHYRKALLELGVELYELKPNPDQQRFWDELSFGSSSRGALHAKTVIIDRRVVFVGSFNLDPRSARLNTEDGLVVESEQLAAQAAGVFASGISPKDSYRVEIRGKTPTSPGDGLVWITEENGREVRYYKDPKTGFWRRFRSRLLYLFAPESML